MEYLTIIELSIIYGVYRTVIDQCYQLYLTYVAIDAFVIMISIKAAG